MHEADQNAADLVSMYIKPHCIGLGLPEPSPPKKERDKISADQIPFLRKA